MKKKNIKHNKQSVNICPCGVSAEVEDTLIWADLGGHMVLLCWDCTDKLHKDFIVKENEKDVQYTDR